MQIYSLKGGRGFLYEKTLIEKQGQQTLSAFVNEKLLDQNANFLLQLNKEVLQQDYRNDNSVVVDADDVENLENDDKLFCPYDPPTGHEKGF